MGMSVDTVAKDHSPTVTVELRQYLEKIVQELDTRHTLAISSLKELAFAKLDALEKSTNAAFLGSEKAITKAEDAQRDYNSRSNEFRGQLDDQAKTLMPRIETMGLFKAQEEKAESARAALERRLDEVKSDVASLRESRSELGGKEKAVTVDVQEGHQKANLNVNIWVGVAVALPAWILLLVMMMGHK